MKPAVILNFIKSNLIVVIALLMAAIAIPVQMVFGAKWSAKIKAEVEQQVSQQMRDLDQLEVNVQLNAMMAGEKPIASRTLPNDATVEAFATLVKARHADSERAIDAVTKFNRRAHALLVDGAQPEDKLFPAPANASARIRLLGTFIERWPKAHADLLTGLHAGMPPTEEVVKGELENLRTREMARRLQGREEQRLNPEEEAEIASLLSERRLELYRRAASAVTVYAPSDVFRAVVPWSDAGIPPERIADESLREAWERQWLLWIHTDLVEAIEQANADARGSWLPVYEAPIRRILSINVQPWASRNDRGGRAGAEASEGGAGAAAGGGGDGSAEMAPDFAHSISGRGGWPLAPNGLYDVRYADLSMVVALERLPRVIDALSKTNAMTVVGVSLSSYRAAPDLERGFYLGSDVLVQADIRVETIWLRSWTTPMMPKPVRDQLGIPDAAPASDQPADPAAGAAEPAEGEAGAEG